MQSKKATKNGGEVGEASDDAEVPKKKKGGEKVVAKKSSKKE